MYRCECWPPWQGVAARDRMGLRSVYSRAGGKLCLAQSTMTWTVSGTSLIVILPQYLMAPRYSCASTLWDTMAVFMMDYRKQYIYWRYIWNNNLKKMVIYSPNIFSTDIVIRILIPNECMLLSRYESVIKLSRILSASNEIVRRFTDNFPMIYSHRCLSMTWTSSTVFAI